jgi:hypothetical protein
MTAIDVGQRDSILLVSLTGRTLLVDAGGLPHWVHSDLDIGARPNCGRELSAAWMRSPSPAPMPTIWAEPPLSCQFSSP